MFQYISDRWKRMEWKSNFRIGEIQTVNKQLQLHLGFIIFYFL